MRPPLLNTRIPIPIHFSNNLIPKAFFVALLGKDVFSLFSSNILIMASEKEIEHLPEDEWVFDSLVNFLHGPLWKLPVSGFIEEKSVVFDPEVYNDLSDERGAEFRKIHSEYKLLVDFMLGSFMEDLEVTAEQVENACKSRDTFDQHNQDSQLTKTALQQLSAAEDFGTFRRLMTRKNIDLQLQSLELLVSKYGILSPALRNSTGEEPSEEDFLQLVLRYSQEAANLDSEGNTCTPLHQPPEARGTQLTRPSQMMDPDFESETSPAMLTSKNVPRKESFVEAVVEAERKIGSAVLEKNESEEALQRTVDDIKSIAPEQRRILASVRLALEHEEFPTKNDSCLHGITEEKVGGSVPVTEDDIQRRREYMRSQRDKLVALKKKEREKQMADSGTRASSSRPKSSKAAQMALKETPMMGTTSEKSLAARRALAKRLKEELHPQ